MNTPIRDLLAESARIEPDTVAIIDMVRGKHWTYRDLDIRVGAMARGLRQLGVEAGDRIVLLGGLTHQIPLLVHACWRTEAVPVLLDPSLSNTRIAEMCNSISATEVLAVDGIEEVPSRSHRFHDIVSEDTTEGNTVPVHHLTHPCVILFTSGTTGSPTPVMLTWENMTSNAVGSALRLGVHPTDRWIVCLQPVHMGGFAPLVRAALYGTGIILVPPESEAIDGAIRSAAATGISLVPPLLQRSLDAAVPLHQLRTVLVGGDQTPPRLIRRARRADVPLFSSYGMTEASSQICTAGPAELDSKPEAVGRPLRWVGISIVDESGEPKSPGESGEIVVSGPTVSPGYLTETEGSRFTEWDGLKTGDIGHVDESGSLIVTGRITDRIVTGGTTVSARTIEQILTTHAEVRDATVLGLPAAEWGEQIGALVTTTTDIKPSAILDDLSEEFGMDETPRILYIVDEIPRTQSGTVDRSAARELFRNLEG